MDIIAAHQQGLVEQLEHEAAALAGSAGDHGQRAVVLHHLYDHSRGVHQWALAEARRSLRISGGLARLGRRLERWGWMLRYRDEARAALDNLAQALGEAARVRCASAHRAYRMSATAALRGEAEAVLPSDFLAALVQCHGARRSREEMTAEVRRSLAEEAERAASAAVERASLDAAWAAIDATGLKRVARRLLGDKALARAAARDERRGWARAERMLREDPTLPATFRANPAQHYYVLQHALRERRRQQWREACDREPGAFELAA